MGRENSGRGVTPPRSVRRPRLILAAPEHAGSVAPIPRTARNALFPCQETDRRADHQLDRKSTRLNSRHLGISYAVFCLKKKRQSVVAIASAFTRCGRDRRKLMRGREAGPILSANRASEYR